MNIDTVLFAYVALCATAAFCLRGDKWLLAAMMFTVMADACLLLLGWELRGVAVFCFAQFSYILRALPNRRWLLLYPLAFIAPLILLALGQPLLLCVSALYAQTLVCAVAATVYAWKTKWFPKWRGRCAALGMMLFLGCDICVALYNLSVIGVDSAASSAVWAAIWLFYAPSQLLLACSAKLTLKKEDDL